MTRVPGTPSDTRPGIPDGKFDPPVDRQFIRVTNLYGTRWKGLPHSGPSGNLTRYLRFGRLAGYVDRAQEQLPYVLDRLAIDPAELGFQRWSADGQITDARLWTILAPSGQAVVALSIDVSASPLETIDLLEDCYYLDVAIGGSRLDTFASDRICTKGGTLGRNLFEPERHQIVFSGPLDPDNYEDVVQKLIYRSDLPYRKEFSAISYPHELNRRPGATVAVGPYVSVLSGQQDYIENCAFLSAAQAVASWVRLREIRDEAYDDLRLFRETESTRQSLLVRRHALERVVNQLGDLELELSYSVESPADLEVLIPSLRVSGYHNTLFDCMGLCDKADTVGRMLQRLERSIRAELTAIESIERRADEDRRLRWTVGIGFLSTVALPVTLILAFFGANAQEVDGQRSMFDSRYLPLYLFVGLMISVGLALTYGLHLRQRLSKRRENRRKMDVAHFRPAPGGSRGIP